MNGITSPRGARLMLIVSLAIVTLSLTFSTISVVTVLSAPLAAPLAGPVTVTVPNQVGFEGFLADASGYPIADGVYAITFAVYSTTTETTPLWSEVQTPTQVTDGLYAVTLGSVTSFPADLFSGNRWIGVQVGASPEITPRTKVASVPFALSAAQALVAGNADLLDGQEGTYYQRRVSGGCSAGSTIRSVNADGSVVCQANAQFGRAAAPSANISTSVDSAGQVGYYTFLTIGADGLPVVSYYGGSNDLKVLHCGNAACTSGNTATTVDSTGNVGEYNSIALGADGLPVVSYYDNTNGNGTGNLKVLHCGNAACTSGNTATIADSGLYVGYDTSIAIGADGLPVVSYLDQGNFDLKVLHCGSTTCTSGNITTTVDSAGMVGAYTSLTIGTDGLPLISYFDSTNSRLKVLHCGNLACSSGNIITAVDSAALNTGLGTSLSIGADGLPVIGYYAGEPNYNLKVLHCGNVACSSGNIATVVDSPGDVGRYPSLTIGMDGLPVVSYFDTTNLDLKVVHCGNATCSSGNNILTLDSGGEIGRYTSITIGADGLPMISYFDDTLDDLKILRCSNAFCVPYFRRR